MERDQSLMPWLHAFKLALIQKDEAALLTLINALPQFDNEDEMHEALSLIGEAQKAFESQQEALKLEMQKIRKSKKYINAL